MIRIIRRNVRLLLILISTILFYLIGWFPVWLLTNWTPWSARQWRVALLRAWARWIGVCIGLRVRTEGEPPNTPYLMVSNHLSYIDILVFFQCSPSTFISKKEVKSWPLLGWMAQTLNILFLDRNRIREIPYLLGEMERLWKSGEGMLVFPEGTTSDGAGVLPFKSSLLAFATETGCPVHVATLAYRTERPDPIADDVVHWFGDAPLWGHAKRLFTLRTIECRVRFNPKGIQDTDRKVLARRLRKETQRAYQSIRDGFTE